MGLIIHGDMASIVEGMSANTSALPVLFERRGPGGSRRR